jgi:PAS domain S-box-containing protein
MLILPWLVFALALLATGIGWDLARESQLRRVQTEFTLRADQATTEIRKRLLAYEQVLRGGVALFGATGTTSRTQWRAYVERLNIAESLSGARAIGFVKVVTDEDKASHIRAMRSEGLPDYDIRPPGLRDVYAPVVYLEPFSDRIPRVTGFDMFTEPVRRATMERARDQGLATISGEVKWVTEIEQKEQKGFIMYLPVYSGGALPASVEARRSGVAGFVYAPFRMTSLIGGMLDPQADGIDLEIFDGAAPASESLLFDLDKTPRFLDKVLPGTLSMLSTIDVNNRTWTLRYEALPKFIATRDDQKPLLVLAGGALISLLLFGLTWFATRTRNTALALAEKMSANLHESERRFGAIFQSAMDAIVSIDDKQVIVHFNPAAEKIFRCTAAEAIGSPLTRLLPERFRASHASHVARFGATGVSDRQMGKQSDLFGLRADGEEFPLEASISQTTELGEKLYTVILRDISARKLAETALRNSEQRFRGLVEVSPEAIYIHQHERLVFVNRAASRLFGAERAEQLVGESVYALFHPDSEASVRQAMASIAAGVSTAPTMERKIVRPDGETRFVEVAVSVYEDAGERAIQEVLRDVTERHLARSELERSHAELRQLSAALETAQEEERKRIARELHDELGQNLTVLKMEISGLKPKVSGGLADQTSRASLISDIDRMDDLLNHTVYSIRRMRPQLLDDLGLVTALEALLKQISRSSQIRCSLNLRPERLSINESLATPLYRIAQEALNNVVKHSQATEATLTVSRDAANTLQLEVYDNGRGFAPEEQRKTASFGLIGMRERVYALKGELVIDSRPAGGTTIRVSIPDSGKAA